MEQKKRKRRRKRKTYKKILRALVMLIPVLLVILVLVIVGRFVRSPKDESIHIEIANVDFTEKNQEEAIFALTEKFPWELTVRYEDNVFAVENFIEEEIQSVVEQAYDEKARIIAERESRGFLEKLRYRFRKEEPVYLQYEIVVPEVDEQLSRIAQNLAQEWAKAATDAAITGFDRTNKKFLYSQPEYGYEIDMEALAASLRDAIESGNYQAEITVTANQIAPTITADDYQLIGTYKTTATNNAARNTNIRVASETIDGMVIAPGEQFSFNGILGRRTEEKGYKEAGAYANGESVQEYGGGVCQVSSTIYNAVIAAGLRTDLRTGHSFEPTYVTPGQDATVSYDQPDFAFTNTSGHPIGLRTIFENPVVRVEIYGVPVLEEGVKQYMKSERTGDVAPPAPEYVEDPTVPFGQEVIQKNAVNGSVWKTNIVTEKNGEVVDTTYFHTTQYKGKSAVIRRNTTNPAVVAPPVVTPPVVETPPAAETTPAPESHQESPAQETRERESSDDSSEEVPQE